MIDKSDRVPLNPQIYEEACEWFLEFRLEEPDVATRKAFDQWMRRSPENVAAYLEVAVVWGDPAAHDARRKWDTESLIAQARAAPDNIVSLAANRTAGNALAAAFVKNEDELNELPMSAHIAASGDASTQLAVTAFDSAASSAVSRRARSRKRIGRHSLAASFVLAVIGATMWHQTQGNTYRTEIGEQRSIRLADGSTVDLNSKTIIRVSYRNDERNVDIKQGQALFKVVADSARPFVVESNGTRVRAVGTQFDVYRKTLGTVVTVVEGKVAVSPPATAPRIAPINHQRSGSTGDTIDVAADRALLLEADEQVTVAPNAPLRIEKGAASTAIAWTRRKIVFSRASLAEVAEEFNRYSTRRLVVENPGEYGFHVSGVFSSTDIESIISFLRTRPGVEIKESASEIRIRKKSR